MAEHDDKTAPEVGLPEGPGAPAKPGSFLFASIQALRPATSIPAGFATAPVWSMTATTVAPISAMILHVQ